MFSQYLMFIIYFPIILELFMMPYASFLGGTLAGSISFEIAEGQSNA